MPTLRTVGESKQFTEQLAAFGDAQFTDKLIDTVKNKLAQYADEFEELIPNSNIRLIKTNEFFIESRIIPALHIWFTIENENRVLLIGITRAVEDEFDEFID